MQEKKAKTEKEELDLALHYIEQLFDSPKVTFESILNGVASADLSETLQRIMSDVVERNPRIVKNDSTKTYQEAKQELNKIFQHFMKELGWSYNDVANADFII